MIALISESMYDCHSPPNNNESSNTRAQYTLNKSRTQTQNCTVCMGKNMQEKWQNKKIVPEACICK